MRVRFVTTWIIAALLLAWPTLAQFYTPGEPSDARSMYYDYTNNRIIELPGSNVYNLNVAANEYISDVTISPDGRYAAWCSYMSAGPESLTSFVIYDLFQEQLLSQMYLQATICRLGRGSFSPFSDRIAVASIDFDYNAYFTDNVGDPRSWVLSVYDFLAEPMQLLTADQIPVLTQPEVPNLPIPLWWTEEDEIYLSMLPIYFEGGYLDRTQVYIWRLDTGRVFQPSDPTWGEYGMDYLPQTDERLWLAFDPALTYTEPMFPYTRAFNVIRLRDAAGERNVYHIGNGWIDRAHFSDNGQYIVVYVYIPRSPDDFDPPYYRVGIPRGGAAQAPELVTISTSQGMPFAFIWRDPFGIVANANSAPFAGVLGEFAAQPLQPTPIPQFQPPQFQPTQPAQFQPPQPTQSQFVAPIVTCPGFMPSRLQPNRAARVLPGLSNRLRNQPSTSGQQIGLIPGGALIYVLEGPVCDTQGRAWWRVDYNGTQGWTAEGQGNEYYIDIVP
ncbi:MAG: SH3 domain-containing protein [Anaerolineae bacterium]|nr:SH3 domain-containing protein [Anaerolineae bacterium]MDW8172245.1 SH3 domain-containing protein [Anaerolineae bacterium]